MSGIPKNYSYLRGLFLTIPEPFHQNTLTDFSTTNRQWTATIRTQRWASAPGRTRITATRAPGTGAAYLPPPPRRRAASWRVCGLPVRASWASSTGSAGVVCGARRRPRIHRRRRGSSAGCRGWIIARRWVNCGCVCGNGEMWFEKGLLVLDDCLVCSINFIMTKTRCFIFFYFNFLMKFQVFIYFSNKIFMKRMN